MRSPRTDAFSLKELLVVIAIMAAMAALLLPVLSRARGASLKAQCASNLRMISSALHMYLADHGQVFPPNRSNTAHQTPQTPAGVYHQHALQPYLPGFRIPTETWRDAGPFWCPADVARRETLPMHSYGIFVVHGSNDEVRFTSHPRPSRSMYLGDGTRSTLSTTKISAKSWPFTPGSSGTRPPGNDGSSMDLRHDGAANILFLDGHVSSFRYEDLVKKDPDNLD